MKNRSRHTNKHICLTAILLISILSLTACVQPKQAEAPPPQDAKAQQEKGEVEKEQPTNTLEPSSTPIPPTETPTPTETPLPEPTDIPGPQLSGLLADPQKVEFQAADGKNLVGYYYPSKYDQAPVIVLMHWAGGNQKDWCVIAPWLQNRLDEDPIKIHGCDTAPAGFQWGGPTYWWDPTWFPPMPAGSSFAVFTFDFRDFGESEAGMSAREEWTLDALAGFTTAAGLEGVDSSRMVSMGASIGSDGAPDGCSLYNTSAGGGCLGAFSLSPGNYLEMPYAEVVTILDSSQPPVPVWCLAGELDGASYKTCQEASGDHYQTQLYMGIEEHGMKLVDPNFTPNPLDLFLEFLALFFEL